MKTLDGALQALDALTERLGRAAAWLSLALVGVTCWIVAARYVFNSGSIAVQESVIYLNSLLFILCSGYTLKHHGHVRVDIFYAKASLRYRAWVDLLGTFLLLLPLCGFLLWISWDYVESSWRVREQSGEAGGLPWVYLLKTLILVLAGLLALQGLAEALRAARVLHGGSAGTATEAERTVV